MAKILSAYQAEVLLMPSDSVFPKDNSLLAMNPPKEVLPAFCLIFGSVLQTCAVCSYLTLNPILMVPKDRLLLSGCGGDLGGGVLAQPW